MAVVLLWVAALLLLDGRPAFCRVKGPCASCHTMHNSQAGVPLSDREDVAFTSSTPQNYKVVNLLKNACIGCHSSTTSDTIVDMGNGVKIPIVYNTVAPNKPLAGGNFYWVDASGDEYGHNVRNVDGILAKAPGGNTSFGAVPSSCAFGGSM
ncbi:MAG: hypothetical protein OEV91_03700, partial [Desulfobulbaceae bacterium]|nr:hypothetical protein [Desulfobulbaceae bacterium]